MTLRLHTQAEIAELNARTGKLHNSYGFEVRPLTAAERVRQADHIEAIQDGDLWGTGPIMGRGEARQ